MVEPPAALLELCLRACGSLRKIPAARHVCQAPVRIAHRKHVHGQVFPVGGQKQASPLFQLGRQQIEKFGTYKSTLVVAFLRPGIRKQDVHFVQAAVRYLVLQDRYYVIHDDPNVVQPFRVRLLQQAADAGSVHFHRQAIPFRVRGRHGSRGLTHTRTDFQHDRRLSAEFPGEIQRARVGVYSVPVPERVEGQPLRRRKPPLSEHIAAYRAAAVLETRPGLFRDQVKNVPSMGEEALA